MQFHLLSKYKIHSLDDGYGDLVIDDLLEIVKDSRTRIVDKDELATEIFGVDSAVRYHYLIKIEELPNDSRRGQHP